VRCRIFRLVSFLACRAWASLARWCLQHEHGVMPDFRAAFPRAFVRKVRAASDHQGITGDAGKRPRNANRIGQRRELFPGKRSAGVGAIKKRNGKSQPPHDLRDGSEIPEVLFPFGLPCGIDEFDFHPMPRKVAQVGNLRNPLKAAGCQPASLDPCAFSGRRLDLPRALCSFYPALCPKR